jgi:DNA-binding transcriptional ArsR family regulator
VLAVLADGSRQAIVELLARRPMTVGALAADLPIGRPAVSMHLKVLKKAQLVRDRPDGTRRIYALDQTGLAALRAYVDRLWSTALDRFAAEAERTHHASHQPPHQPPQGGPR